MHERFIESLIVAYAVKIAAGDTNRFGQDPSERSRLCELSAMINNRITDGEGVGIKLAAHFLRTAGHGADIEFRFRPDGSVNVGLASTPYQQLASRIPKSSIKLN